MAHPLPHRHRDRARPSRIGTETGLTFCRIGAGTHAARAEHVPFGWIPPALRALARSGFRAVSLELADGLVHRVDSEAADASHLRRDLPARTPGRGPWGGVREHRPRDGLISGDRVSQGTWLAFVSNKHTREWGHAPSNFIGLAVRACLEPR